MSAVTPDEQIDAELLREEGVEDVNEAAEALVAAAPLS